jgi:hypothetical protein
MGEYKRVACDGKISFESFDIAKRVTTRKNGKGRNPYKCRHCNQWHVGGMYLRKAKRLKLVCYE